MARSYANENFPFPVVEALRRLGHEALTIQETGKAGQAAHFIRFHTSFPTQAGIVVCTFDPDFAGQANRIHQAVQELSRLAGQLIRINRPKG